MIGTRLAITDTAIASSDTSDREFLGDAGDLAFLERFSHRLLPVAPRDCRGWVSG